jgi:hypothetical protein
MGLPLPLACGALGIPNRVLPISASCRQDYMIFCNRFDHD